MSRKRRAKVGSSFSSIALLLVLGSSCGATVRDQAGDAGAETSNAGSGGTGVRTDTGADTSAADAAQDTSTGGPFGPWCQDGQGCSSIGETCTNDCGFPCVCLATPTARFSAPWFSCYEPPTGTRCDPATSRQCWYAAADDPSREGPRGDCYCSERLGEPYWVCTGHNDVCPVVGPKTGDSCEGFPAGLVCGYDDPSGWRGCECDLAHIWQCSA